MKFQCCLFFFCLKVVVTFSFLAFANYFNNILPLLLSLPLPLIIAKKKKKNKTKKIFKKSAKTTITTTILVNRILIKSTEITEKNLNYA